MYASPNPTKPTFRPQPGSFPVYALPRWGAVRNLANKKTGHPTQAQHEALSSLVDTAREKLGRGKGLTSLLESDLGAPLPLHVSLSRPLALTTAQKDDFLARLEGAIRGCGVLP